MTIRNFSIEYDAINSQNIFTNGDTINGRIVVEVSKETPIQSLTFIGKGSAKVRWVEHHHKHTRYYWSDEQYYDIKQHILRAGTEFIAQGRHVFPFSFKVPNGKMPSSFKASTGRIVHKLKAELKQSMKLTKTAKAHFTFVSKADMDIAGLMEPQHVCIEHNFKSCGSGTVTMNVYTEQMAYKADETLNIKVEINNQSTVSVRPKFTIYRKQKILLPRQRIIITSKVLQNLNKADIIAANSRVTVTKTIPLEKLPGPICGVAKNEYQLKVCLKPTRKFAEQRILVFRDNSELVPQTLAQLALMNNGMNRQPEYF
ncbi:arrestin domain-containing protein 3-like isoform X2 [Hippocampus zosterae]|uniref:arrestin domain-containing protein 3-like isoform X2 n=1 Tax=Hippocampus zosterae TaxID=109293 RepID=UPI00223CCEED|nr:arrestin domain-containing protein 3-like isoform X2 [Hippocampus zosterae]